MKGRVKRWVKARLRGRWERPYRHGQLVSLELEAYREMLRRAWVYPGEEA